MYNENLTWNSYIQMSKIGFLPKLQVSEHGGGVFVLGKFWSDKNIQYIKSIDLPSATLYFFLMTWAVYIVRRISDFKNGLYLPFFPLIKN